MDWKAALRAIVRPTDYIKRRCVICRRAMDEGDDGVFRCSNGHSYDPNKKSEPDSMNAGDHHGKI